MVHARLAARGITATAGEARGYAERLAADDQFGARARGLLARLPADAR